MRVLILLTRNPYATATGRTAVLRTVVDGVCDNADEVDAVVYDPDLAPLPPKVKVYRRHPPRGIGLIATMATHTLIKGSSLNESIYYSKGEVRFLKRLHEQRNYDVVVSDMLRTVPLAAEIGCPMILDLDDLLSERYEAWADKSGEMRCLLGYFAEKLPLRLRDPANKVAQRLLRWESRRIRRNEEYWARRVAAVSLVSEIEAEKLEARVGRKVHSLPMAIPSATSDWVPDGPFRHQAVFVGGMDYQPNLDAVKWFRENVSVHLESVSLHVVGRCPVDLKKDLESPCIQFIGYVDDVLAELSRSAVFIAPIVSGSGIKTKVLEALSVGVPIVGTNESVAGIGLRHGEHCLIANSGREFAQAIRDTLLYPQEAARRAAAGREVVRAKYSPEVLRAKWRDVLATVVRN